MSSTSTSRIHAVKVLKKYPNETEALALLMRAANIVTPTLERRGWKVKTLTEFYPGEVGLLGLNVNRGQTIKVRLRTAENRESFLPFEHILGTLVHEITHNKIGPHSAEFYKLMEELYTEVEKDMANGVTAAGKLNCAAFTGTAHRLGCSAGRGSFESWSTACKPSSASARRTVQATAALARQERALLSRGSGQVLGTATEVSTHALSPRALRETAAQKRKQSQATVRNESRETKKPRVMNVVLGSKKGAPIGKQSAGRPPQLSQSPSASEVIAIVDDSDDDDIRGALVEKSWACKICTFENTSYSITKGIRKGTEEICTLCGSNHNTTVDDFAADDDVKCLGSCPMFDETPKLPSSSTSSASSSSSSSSSSSQRPLERESSSKGSVKNQLSNKIALEWTCNYCTFVNNYQNVPRIECTPTDKKRVCGVCEHVAL